MKDKFSGASKREKEKHNDIKQESQYNTSTLLAIVVLQFIVTFILLTVLNSGILESADGNPAFVRGVFIFILGFADFLITRRLLGDINKAALKKCNQGQVANSGPDNQLISAELINNAQLLNNRPEDKKAGFIYETEELYPAIPDTTPLNKDLIGYPYLEPDNQDGSCRIIIDKASFVVGRLQGQADYLILNNAIGRMHAEFIKRDGVCYVKDLNSFNGTIVNDTRIDSNVEYEIRDSDIVAFANIRYTYHERELQDI